jgi:hypothetical protein
LGVRHWGIWTKEESAFPWHYDEKETLFFLRIAPICSKFQAMVPRNPWKFRGSAFQY